MLLTSLRVNRSTFTSALKISISTSATSVKMDRFSGLCVPTMPPSPRFTSIQVWLRAKSTVRCLSCSCQAPWTGRSSSGVLTHAWNPSIPSSPRKSTSTMRSGVRRTRVCSPRAMLRASSTSGTSTRTERFRSCESRYRNAIGHSIACDGRRMDAGSLWVTARARLRCWPVTKNFIRPARKTSTKSWT